MHKSAICSRSLRKLCRWNWHRICHFSFALFTLLNCSLNAFSKTENGNFKLVTYYVFSLPLIFFLHLETLLWSWKIIWILKFRAQRYKCSRSIGIFHGISSALILLWNFALFYLEPRVFLCLSLPLASETTYHSVHYHLHLYPREHFPCLSVVLSLPVFLLITQSLFLPFSITFFVPSCSSLSFSLMSSISLCHLATVLLLLLLL